MVLTLIISSLETMTELPEFLAEAKVLTMADSLFGDIIGPMVGAE